MIRERRGVIAPVAGLVVAAVAFAVAGRFGGGDAVTGGSAHSSPAPADDVRWEVAVRLTDVTGMTTVDAPNGAPSAGALGRRGRMVAPWDAGEASVHTRASLVTSAPSSLGFAVDVPARARFSFAAASAGATADAIVFETEVTDERGITTSLCTFRLPPGSGRRWHERRCALDAYAGQRVTIRLVTAGEPATTNERTVALWGNPIIETRTAPRIPMNVLWIVVESLRPDDLASFHEPEDDARARAAGDAWLPRIEGLTPAMDGLAARGVRFTRAYSAATWTRPAMLAMMAGARATEVEADPDASVAHARPREVFDASDAPLLPRLLRRRGVFTRAVVDGAFMNGRPPFGVDLGFEELSEHRDPTRATDGVTHEAVRVLERAGVGRFFVMVNYASARGPSEPPPELVARVPPPPAGPVSPRARLHMAEAAEVDRGVARLLEALARTGNAERTIVVLTSAHGETLASAHAGSEGTARGRDRADARNFEETTHVPLVVVAPGLLPPGTNVGARVRSTDVAPTVLELLGEEVPARMSGRSLVGLSLGRLEPERVVVSEGRGSRAIIVGDHRLVVTEGAARSSGHGPRTGTSDERLFDLTSDPGERRDLSGADPERVEELRARLRAAVANVAAAGSDDPSPTPPRVLHLRFAGAGRARRVSGSIVVGDARERPSSVLVTPVDVGKETFTRDGGRLVLALTTNPMTSVGFDIVVDPPSTPVGWQLYLDDAPWPSSSVFGGPFGIAMPTIDRGVTSASARAAVTTRSVPRIDPARDLGLFVTRDPGVAERVPVGSAEAAPASGEASRPPRDPR